jgi:hypothetical protein
MAPLWPVDLVVIRIQLDRFQLFLPVSRRRLERHVIRRFGGRLLVGHRLVGSSLLLDGVGDRDVVGKCFAVLHAARDTPQAVAENRRDQFVIPNAKPCESRLRTDVARTFCVPGVLGSTKVCPFPLLWRP